MTEFVEILKTVGPAIAILIWLVFQLWKECGEKESKIYDMYERLIGGDKRMLLANTRMLTAQLKNENMAESFIDFLNAQAEDLKKEIDEIKAMQK